jgi:hypothetical protein
MTVYRNLATLAGACAVAAALLVACPKATGEGPVSPVPWAGVDADTDGLFVVQGPVLEAPRVRPALVVAEVNLCRHLYDLQCAEARPDASACEEILRDALADKLAIPEACLGDAGDKAGVRGCGIGGGYLMFRCP